MCHKRCTFSTLSGCVLFLHPVFLNATTFTQYYAYVATILCNFFFVIHVKCVFSSLINYSLHMHLGTGVCAYKYLNAGVCCTTTTTTTIEIIITKRYQHFKGISILLYVAVHSSMQLFVF